MFKLKHAIFFILFLFIHFFSVSPKHPKFGHIHVDTSCVQQSSLSSPIHAVKPSLSFKVVNYIVHCLLPKTIKPTLWTSRDFSQSVSNIGLYNLWQEGIFFQLEPWPIPERPSHTHIWIRRCLDCFPVFALRNISTEWLWKHMAISRHAAEGSQEVSLEKKPCLFCVCMCVCRRARVYVCMSVCVCVREKEAEVVLVWDTLFHNDL